MDTQILDRTSFASTQFQLETSQAPKIKAAQSSSSDILNRYFTSLSQDLSLLSVRTNILAQRCQRVDQINQIQGAGYHNLFNSLSSRVNAVTGTTEILVDMFSSLYVDSSTTTQIDYKFGQAVLPVSSSTDLIVSTDIYGNNYINSTTQFSWVETSTVASSSTPPSINSFQIDPEGLFMLRGDQSWLHAMTTGSAIWVLVTVPIQYLGFNPNVLEIWPLPIGQMDLASVWYQESGSNSDNGWIQLDLSYLQNYNGTTKVVNQLTPIRLLLNNDTVSQFCFAFNVNGSTTTGLSKIKLLHNEYQTNAQLVINNPYSDSLGTVLLRGQDPSNTLSNLPVLITSNQAVVTMQTTQSNTTPCVTGIIVQN